MGIAGRGFAVLSSCFVAGGLTRLCPDIDSSLSEDVKRCDPRLRNHSGRRLTRAKLFQMNERPLGKVV